ncbi:MAG: tRNA preQ1(34) S-adenosylmethionine ribosyltransferase-isomerase QueA [Desulfobacula sp.]|jgi:S-adenosylmethionine:tRNA ribosyltransferase-isomerase|nr:tRNA preQ1(34) S-adenosylmethionine ribosyltransferase-isomerase QueA [Desulfobacula sp.]
MYLLSDYDYELPEKQIAQVPCKDRSGSKLLHIDRKNNGLNHYLFRNLTDLLMPGDLLVVNNTRVIPARLMGKKSTGGRVEVLVIDYSIGLANLEKIGFFQCDCLIKASKSPKQGAILYLGDKIKAQVVQVKGYVTEVRFLGGAKFIDFLKNSGHIPLPPYIKRADDINLAEQDKESYQTVYAAAEGAVAAPTAGLHFTKSLITDLEAKGVEFANITLHVGYGTFVPVRVDDIRDHQIHSEFFTMSREAAKKINKARQEKRRVIAVGTTSVRTLEFLADENGCVTPGSGMCDLFIYPGYTFKCVDAMITNFHLPQSTLLMLVSAFYDRKKMIQAYETAIKEDYRFFSYGDAMLIQ